MSGVYRSRGKWLQLAIVATVASLTVQGSNYVDLLSAFQLKSWSVGMPWRATPVGYLT